MTKAYRTSSPLSAAVLTGGLGNAALAYLAAQQFLSVSMVAMTILGFIAYCAWTGLYQSRAEIDDVHSGGARYLRASGTNLVITGLASAHQAALQSSALSVARSLAALLQQIMLATLRPYAEATLPMPARLPAAGVNLTPRLIPVPHFSSAA